MGTVIWHALISWPNAPHQQHCSPSYYSRSPTATASLCLRLHSQPLFAAGSAGALIVRCAARRASSRALLLARQFAFDNLARAAGMGRVMVHVDVVDIWMSPVMVGVGRVVHTVCGLGRGARWLESREDGGVGGDRGWGGGEADEAGVCGGGDVGADGIAGGGNAGAQSLR